MEVGTRIELWHLLTACGAVLVFFLGITATLGKLLVHQFKEHVDEKFKAMEEARKASSEHWDEQFGKMEEARNASSKHWDDQFGKLDNTARQLETDFLKFKADLPLHYVRREDYVRGQTVIESKIDAVMSKIELLQIQGAKHG